MGRSNSSSKRMFGNDRRISCTGEDSKKSRQYKRKQERLRKKTERKLRGAFIDGKNANFQETSECDAAKRDSCNVVGEKIDSIHTNVNALELKKFKKTKLKKGHNNSKASSIDDFVEKQVAMKQRDAELSQRESTVRRRDLKLKLQQSHLERTISAAELSLRCWYPGKKEYLQTRERKKKRRFDPTRLRGAAKPAEEAYPHLFPEYHAEKERREFEEEENELSKGDDILAANLNHWGNHVETRNLLSSNFLLARVHIQQADCDLGLDGRVDSVAKKHLQTASKILQKVSSMDSDCFLGSWTTLFRSRCFLGLGDLDSARAVVEQELSRVSESPDLDCLASMLLWDLFFIEYWSKNEEKLEEIIKKAIQHSPSILFVLQNGSLFCDEIDLTLVDLFFGDELERSLNRFVDSTEARFISPPAWNAQEIAVVYFARTKSFWHQAAASIMEYLLKNFGSTKHLTRYLNGLAIKYSSTENVKSRIESEFVSVWNKVRKGK